MIRQSSQTAARRAMRQVVRGVVMKSNDDPMMQELDLKTTYSEEPTKVERFQQPGFSSVPLDPKDKKHAEAIVVYPQGNSSHPVVVATDDRRVRPTKRKPGTSTFYDQKNNKHFLEWDENGNLVINFEKGTDKKFIIKFGDDTYTFHKEGLNIEIDDGHSVRVNKKRIDHKHKHKDVTPGSGTTGDPIP
jgi:phage gp45-like